MEDKTSLLEKEMKDKKETLKLENESAAKLYSKFKLDLDFNYKPFQSSPSCRGSAYSFMLKEKPLYCSALDVGIQRLENPLGSAYASLFGSSSYGLPCDLGLLR